MFPIFFAMDTTCPSTPAPPACPMCGGPLFELRGLNRCARCHYVICLNCDGERAEPVEPDVREW
jgi:hypothetical protein